MSDLIDLDASNESLPQPALAPPLLPCPSETSDASRHSLSSGDNPFDRVTQEVDRYIHRSKDPFELVSDSNSKPNIVIQAQCNSNCSSKSRSLGSSPIIKLSEDKNGKCSGISTKSNNQLLNTSVSIVVDPPPQQDLSILNESAMNDALLEDNSSSILSNKLGCISPIPKVSSIMKYYPIRKSNSYIRGMNTSNLSNCSSIRSSNSSIGSDYMNKAFIAENLSASTDRLMNGSGVSTASSKSDISDIVQKYKDFKSCRETQRENKLIDIEGTVNNDSPITDNVNEYISKYTKDVSIDHLIEEANAVSKAINSIVNCPKESPNYSIADISPPNFTDISLLNDEGDNLIEFSDSPRKSKEKSDDKKEEKKETSPKECESEKIAKEVETDLFSLKDPKNRRTALTLLIDLKNIVQVSKPNAVKLLDDLESNLDLNCDDNLDLMSTFMQNLSDYSKTKSRQNSNEDNEEDGKVNKDEDSKNNTLPKNDTEKENKSNNLADNKKSPENIQDVVESKEKSDDVKKVFENLQNLLQCSSSMDSGTKNLLKEVGSILCKLSEPPENSLKSIENINERSRSELRRSKLLNHNRRSFTPDGKTNPQPESKLRRSFSTTSFSNPFNPSKRSSNNFNNSSNKQKVSTSLNNLSSLKSDIKDKKELVPEIPKAKLVPDIKSKLKRKIEIEPVTKKGPLRAIIPVNNMQKNKSSLLSNKMTLGPTSMVRSPLNNSCTNPLAASTPVVRRSISQNKTKKMDVRLKSNPTNNKAENFSSKPKNSSRINKLHIPSPIKYPSSPRRNMPNLSKSPRSNRSKRSSNYGLMETLSNQNMLGSDKVLSQKSIMSPLRTNNQNVPGKRFSMVTKPRNLGIDYIAEKENQYL